MSLNTINGEIVNTNYDADVSNLVSGLRNLPIDILRIIVSLLENHKDVICLTSINKQFKALHSDGVLCDFLLAKYFPSSYANFKSDFKSYTSPALYKQLKIQLHNMKNGKYRVQTINHHQKEAYCITVLDNKIISGCGETIKIWDPNTGKELQTLNGHQGVMSCIEILDEKIVSGSGDKTIKIWDPNTGKELQTLNGHQHGITCIKIWGGKIISSSWDQMIKIWDPNIRKELQTLNGHQHGITCIKIWGGKIISSSWDQMIKIWDPNIRKELQTLNGHQEGITCIDIWDEKIVSGSGDKTIKIWDPNTGKELQTLNGHQGGITCIGVWNGKIVSSSLDKTIKIWDPNTGKELHTLNGHQNWITCIRVWDGKIVSSSWDKTIKIWDPNTGKELHTLNGHQDVIRCIKSWGGKIISGSGDKTIKIWDFNFLSLSLYSPELAEKNLTILGEMANAEYKQNPECVEKLAEQLHSDFKERLKQHSFKVGASFSCSAEVILRVQTEVCIEALLNAIHSEDHERVSELLGQLTRIDSQNTKIYGLLLEICGKPMIDKWGKYAFNNQNGCSATLLQKEEAVIAFKQELKDRWGEDVSFLLFNLAIVTKEQYSEKLDCSPDFLPKIGIYSSSDLQALFNSPDFQYLQVIPDEKATEDRKELQDRAFDRKATIFTFLNELLAAAQQKSEETKQCSILCDKNGNVCDADNSWIAFQEKLNNIQVALDKDCQTSRELLEKFSPESYTQLIKEVNALIGEFRNLERETQILRLHAYVNQWGILNKWNNLRNEGVKSLADLLEQKEITSKDVFNMGE